MIAMIKIRKRGELWEVEDCNRCGEISRSLYDLDRVRQIIISRASHIDTYASWALEIMNNQSDVYMYQGGELIRKKPVGHKIFCMTPYLEARYHLEIFIHRLESGVWKVREWKTPDCLLSYYEPYLLIKKPVKKHYMIIETTDPNLMPVL